MKKKNGKGMLAFVLAGLLVFACAGAAMALEKDVDGYYLIETSQDLADFRDLVNSGDETDANARLTADIDLEGEQWEPIGQHIPESPNGRSSAISADYSYRGEFDGGGHCVTNFVITSEKVVRAQVEGNMDYVAGFFGVLSTDAVISDLCLEEFSVDVPKGANNFYVLCGGLVAANLDGRIEGVRVTNGAVSAKTHAGGIAGYNSGTITNSTADGAMTLTSMHALYVNYVGSIAAHNGNGGTIANCTANIGEMKITTTYDSFSSYSGGLVGYNEAATIMNCTVNGTGSIEGGVVAGGIVGYNRGGTITNCTANGAMTITADSSRLFSAAGGIAGENVNIVSKDKVTVLNHAVIQNSVAEGIKEISAKNYAGGVLGYNASGTVMNCFASEIGGIEGYHSDEGNGYECYSGGIVGYNVSGVITNCLLLAGETPTVLSGDTYEGGVLGALSSEPGNLDLVQSCAYPSNVVFQNSEENRPIGNIPLEDLKEEFQVTSYDVDEDVDTLPAIVAIIEQGMEVEVQKGKTRRLDVTTLPGTNGIDEMTFMWASESADIAAVSPESGAVVSLTGVELGTTNVTCKITGRIEAELVCAVTVVERKDGPDGPVSSDSSNCSTLPGGFVLLALSALPFIRKHK